MVDKNQEETDRLLAELLLRISTVEKLLIDKNLITKEEYTEIFTNSVEKLTNLLKQAEQSLELPQPGVLKN